MFGFFQNKKKLNAAKKLESNDSFYRAPDDEDLDMGNKEMNDEEYGRRVTEEIAKRKSVSKHGATPISSRPTSDKPITGATSVRQLAEKFSPAPSPSKQAMNTKSPTPVSASKVSVKKTAPLSIVKPNMLQSALAPRPVSATVAVTPPVNRPSAATTPVPKAVASRPNSATAAPNSISVKNGFIADTKAIQQLVSMGFSYPSATFALMKTSNHVDQATEFLLEHSDAEMTQLLAAEGGFAVPNKKVQSPVAATPPPPSVHNNRSTSPRSTDPSLKRTMSSKNNSNIDATKAPALVLSSSSGSPRSYVDSSEENSPKSSLVRNPSMRLSKPRDPAVDSAMAAIIAKREALKASNASGASPAPSPSSASPAAAPVGEGAVKSTRNRDTFSRLSSYKTQAMALTEQKQAEDRQRIEAQEQRRKVLRDSSPAPSAGASTSVVTAGVVATSTAPSAAAPSPATTTVSTVPVLENTAFEILHLKKTKSMLVAEETEQQRLADERALEQRRKLLRDSSPHTARGGNVSSNSSVHSTSSNVDHSAFESLHSKKTHAMLLAEQVDEIRRRELEATEREIQAQEQRRRQLRDSSPARQNISSNSSVASTLSYVDNSAFEELHSKKTRSMLVAEEVEEKLKLEQDAADRKWKKVTRRNSGADSDSEIFEKLHATKIASIENREIAVIEDKYYAGQAEAHLLGRSGATLPELVTSEDSPLLKKTQSMYMRELLLEESRQRLEEERAAKELISRGGEGNPIPRRPSFSTSRSASPILGRQRLNSDDSASVRGQTPLSAQSTGSAPHHPPRYDTGLLDGIGATLVDDCDSDDDEEDTATRPALPQSQSFKTPPLALTTPSRSFKAKQSFRKSDSGASSGTLRPIPAHIHDIVGLTKRTAVPHIVYETADHRWAGKLTIPANAITGTASSEIALKGVYSTREQCMALTAAQAPPIWVEVKKNATCRVCEEAFNKYLKAEHCNNCGQLVCSDCSEETWPTSMLPVAYVDKKAKPRTCSACNQLMEKLVTALKGGDLEEVQALHATGNVNFHNPFSIFPDAPYPVHCAAASGNVELLSWLVEHRHCLTKDIHTGEPVVNAAGHTILAVAARRGDMAMMRHALHSLGCSVQELTDVSVLQRGLHAALEAPGQLPSIHKKPPKSPLITPNTSFRRYEKLTPTREAVHVAPVDAVTTVAVAAEEIVVDTGALQAKAADLAARLTVVAVTPSPSTVAASALTITSTPASAAATSPKAASASGTQFETAQIASTSASSAPNQVVPSATLLARGMISLEVDVNAAELSALPTPEGATPAVAPLSATAAGAGIAVSSPLGRIAISSASTESHSSASSGKLNQHAVPPSLSTRSASTNSLLGSTSSSPRGENNHSQSFITGTKRMNSTKMEPPQAASPTARLTMRTQGLARSASNPSNVLLVPLGAAAATHAAHE